MGKAERAGLELRPSDAGLKDRAAYGLMASHFLRESSLSRNRATGEVRTDKLSASHCFQPVDTRPLAPSESRGEPNDRAQFPDKEK